MGAGRCGSGTPGGGSRSPTATASSRSTTKIARLAARSTWTSAQAELIRKKYGYSGGGDSTWEPDAGYYLIDSVTTDKTTFWAQLGMNNAGGSAAHNNMPPYLSVYMWERVS